MHSVDLGCAVKLNPERRRELLMHRTGRTTPTSTSLFNLAGQVHLHATDWTLETEGPRWF